MLLTELPRVMEEIKSPKRDRCKELQLQVESNSRGIMKQPGPWGSCVAGTSVHLRRQLIFSTLPHKQSQCPGLPTLLMLWGNREKVGATRVIR